MSEQNIIPSTYEYIKVNDSLELRALSSDYAQKMFDLTISNRAYLAEFLPWADATKTVDDTRAFIEKTIAERTTGDGYGFGIIVSGQLVGHIGLHNISKGEKLPEIGYWIAESASGKGITTAAAKAMTEFGQNQLGLDKIILKARPDNKASNKIAENLGYKFDGVHADEQGTVHNLWVIEKI